MQHHVPAIAIALVIGASLATGAPAMVKYDQRQEGEWNVRADLENFVILIIPTSQQSSPTPAISLLDLLTKGVPSRGFKRKHNKKVTRPTHDDANVDANVDTQAFIESKTAPYHVDISRSRNNLAKLRPADVAHDSEKLLESPTISLLKPNHEDLSRAHGSLRISRGFVVASPSALEELIKGEQKSLKDKKKTEAKKENKKEKLTLIGAEYEQCGPDYERDAKGICRSKDNK